MAEPLAETRRPCPAPAWRVYGIVPADAALPDPAAVSQDAGIGDRGLQLLRHGPIAAVVEPVDPGRPARRPDLLAHSAVLNALAAPGPVLPIAFGAAFADRDQVVTEFLAGTGVAETLAARLDELRGRAQFQIRVRYDMDALLSGIVAADPRVAELRRRTRELSEDESYPDRVRLGEIVSHAVEMIQNADTDRLLDLLGRHAERSAVSSTSLAVPSTSLAFLVTEAARPGFETAAEQAAAELHERAAVELHGPLAAFDFVET